MSLSQINTSNKLKDEEQTDLKDQHFEIEMKGDGDEKSHLEEESKPMRITNLFVDSPCKVICFFYLILLICLVITGAAGYMNPVLGGGRNRDFAIWDDPIYIAWDTLYLARDEMDATKGQKVVPLQSKGSGSIYLLYSAKDGGSLLKKEIFQKILEIENELINDEEAKKFCLAVDGSDPIQCDLNGKGFTSPYKVIVGQKDINTLTDQDLEKSLKMIINSPSWPLLKSLFDENVNADNVKITHMRSIFVTAGPIQIDDVRYDNATDRRGQQQDHLKTFLMDRKDKFTEKYEDLGEFRAQFVSDTILFDEIQNILLKDMTLIAASVAFVFLYFWFHLKSSFLALVGISIIFLSFPFSAVFVQGICRVSYFGALQVISIFLVIGIAADDIFVFVDAWKQSKHMLPGADKKKRMAYAFRRGVRAMTVTSSTTAVAFFANVFSPIMPIRAFGIFSGVLIPVNFLLVVMIMPPAVIYFEDKFEGKTCNQICSKTTNQEEENTESEQQAEVSKIEVFFDEQCSTMVMKGKYAILILSFAWFVVTLIFAPQMGPQTDEVQFIKESHPIWEPFDIMTKNFEVSNAQKPDVRFFWGTSGIDKEGINKWDPEDIGKIMWDDQFDPSSEESQTFLMNLCSELKKQEFVFPESTQCWIENFKAFQLKMGLQFPVAQADFNQQIQVFLSTVPRMDENVGFRNGKIKFMIISAQTPVFAFAPASTMDPERQKWQDFMDNQASLAPASVKNFLQTSRAWINIPTEQAYVKSAFQGIAIALSFSFIVLMIVTLNPITSLSAILCVSMVITSLVTFMHWNGQQFGSDESIAVVMLVGFAVDYVLHLSTDYMHSLAPKRGEKMRQAYREMGISIFSGACTTFGSGAFLFFGNILFFQKFAMIICVTVVMAFASAILTFGAMMFTWGPQNNFCTIKCKK